MSNLRKIRAKLKDTINLSDFLEETRDIWDRKYYEIVDKLSNNIYNLVDTMKLFLEESDSFETAQKSSKNLSFKLINLSIFMIATGCNFEIESKLNINFSEDLEEINGGNIIEHEALLISRREFEVKYKQQKMNDGKLIDLPVVCDEEEPLD